MKTATATLQSIAPYSQSGFHDTPKLDKETPDDYEKRTWRSRLHETQDGHVFIPPMAFKNCLADAAKFVSRKIPGKRNATYTKHFLSGVLVTDGLVLPDVAAEVEGEWLFVPADGVRGSGKRVKKCYPVIREWTGQITFHVLDDTITESVFLETLQEAGNFIGIGRFRPQNGGYYGRFTVTDLQWIDSAADDVALAAE